MASQIRPLSAVDPEPVLEYLGRQGVPEEIVRWKYLDRTPLPEHDRAQVALKDGRIAGFIGLIPLDAPHGLRAAWTCDWFADAEAGALGIALLSGCLKGYEAIYQLGGNERTQSILKKLAKTTIPGAGIEYRLPLRLGSYLRPLAHRARVPIHRGLGLIPLHGRRGARPEGSVRPGIAPELAQRLGGRYSVDYLEWQLGRCPVVSCYSCLPAGRHAGAAVVLWTPRSGGGFWRMAPVSGGASPDDLQAALALAIRHVYDSRGLRLSVLISHRDETLRRLVETNGFAAASERRMMNVLTRPALAKPAEELTAVSFLDSDIAYRF